MNPLPWHLFLTGEFQIKLPEGTIETFKPHHLTAMENNPEWLEYSTLIARPIEDMSEEEKEEIWSYFETGEAWEEHRLNLEEDYRMHAGGSPDVPMTIQSETEELEDILSSHTPSTLKALSFGVFPFDQRHFGDTVIDTRTLTNV